MPDTLEKIKQAQEDLQSGYNCAQSIFRQYYKELGISEDLAMKISTGFGGGMRRGHTCGVITGAIMVLGLYFADYKNNDNAKKDTYKIVRGFTDEFLTIHPSTCCKELIGYDTGNEEERAKASELGLFKELCPKFIETSIILLEKRINNK